MTDQEKPATSSREPEMEPCPRCGTRIRTSEMNIHLAHAHNYDPTARKPGRRGRNRDDR